MAKNIKPFFGELILLYKLLRPALFLLPPELAHKLCLNALQLAYKLGITKLLAAKPAAKPYECFGIHFTHRAGIAAGLDKNGDYIDALASLGVGFIEVGGVTPQPQAGNPKPRLFRLTQDRAIINCMGLNNKGLDYLVAKLKQRKTSCPVGVNLAKGHATANENAAEDYLLGLEKIYLVADFVVINISCPNSSNIEALQNETLVSALLSSLLARRNALQNQHNKPLPLLVKISPDLTAEQLAGLLTVFDTLKIDGIIAANTTTTRTGLTNTLLAKQKGGLSGAPLTEAGLASLKQIKQQLPNMPVISVGGIMSSKQAQARLALGADLIEVYTGLIYEGFGLIKGMHL
jgi:dihydroorotate dehydrogenase